MGAGAAGTGEARQLRRRWMSALVLDTTVLIDVLRGRSAGDRVQALLADGDTLMTTAVNVEEITRGMRPSEEHATGRLFSALVVLSITHVEAGQSGTWRREYATQGIVLHQADCLIAAATAQAGAHLATANLKDFPMLPGQVDHWPAG